MPTSKARATTSDSASALGGTEQIGQRLRSLRSEKGLTILELAAKAGVSSGIISQIERGNSNPSIKTLSKLRAALGVNLWEFLDSEQLKPSDALPFVRRKEKRPRIVIGDNQLTKELLSPRNNDDLRFMILTFPPGAQSQDVLNGPGDKGGYVMSGRIELTVDETVAELGVGDSFQFKSSLPHHVVNRFDEVAQVLWIISTRESHL